MNIPRVIFSACLVPLILGGCRQTAKEDPETSPSGPSVLSQAAIDEALRGPVDFRRHIEPLLRQNCLYCHDGKARPDLVNFSRRDSVLAPGPYGPRLVPGNPGKSLMVNNLSLTHAPVQTMPPVGNRLTAEETAVLSRWIEQGAAWPRR